MSDADAAAEGESVADDSTHLEALAFPGVRYRDAVRLHFQSRFVRLSLDLVRQVTLPDLVVQGNL